MHLILARHGETEWNVARRIQGWANSPLTARGIAQAGRLAARIDDISFTAAYSSDLGRAVQTALIAIGDRATPLTQLHDLRETSWGQWEGMTAEEIDAAQPDLWRRFAAHGGDMNESEDEADWENSTLVPKGETLTQGAGRIAAALKEIKGQHPGDDEWVLVVGHGGSLRFFLTLALGLPPRRIRRFHIDNASLTHIQYLSGHPPIIKCVNDVADGFGGHV